MKYKNINSAIHNFGHSFTSYENYVDSDYVIDELGKIHSKGYDIELDWISKNFEPVQFLSARLKKSIGFWFDSMSSHMSSHNVELEKLTVLYFKWPANDRKFMYAIDDRNKEYKIYINDAK